MKHANYVQSFNGWRIFKLSDGLYNARKGNSWFYSQGYHSELGELKHAIADNERGKFLHPGEDKRKEGD